MPARRFPPPWTIEELDACCTAICPNRLIRMPETGTLIGSWSLGVIHARNCHTPDPGWSARCVGTARSTYARSSGGHSNCALASLRSDHGGMYTGGFCSLRRQDGFWDGSGLYSADYVRNAATETGHEGLAANRPGGRRGMQEAKSEFWKGWPS